MKPIILFIAALIIFTTHTFAQDHGFVTYKGQTIGLTTYRTRLSNGKRWIIADGRKDGKLYSVTVTLRPDVTTSGSVTTDATHTVTLTTSKEDYSGAENFCFDGGSVMSLVVKPAQYTVTGKDMKSGNCSGKASGNDKLSFAIKPRCLH